MTTKGDLYRDAYAVSAGLGSLWIAPAVMLVVSGDNFVVPAASAATAYYLYDGTATGLINAYVGAGSVFAFGFQVLVVPQIINIIQGWKATAESNAETWAASEWNSNKGWFLKWIAKQL